MTELELGKIHRLVSIPNITDIEATNYVFVNIHTKFIFNYKDKTDFDLSNVPLGMSVLIPIFIPNASNSYEVLNSKHLITPCSQAKSLHQNIGMALDQTKFMVLSKRDKLKKNQYQYYHASLIPMADMNISDYALDLQNSGLDNWLPCNLFVSGDENSNNNNKINNNADDDVAGDDDEDDDNNDKDFYNSILLGEAKPKDIDLSKLYRIFLVYKKLISGYQQMEIERLMLILYKDQNLSWAQLLKDNELLCFALYKTIKTIEKEVEIRNMPTVSLFMTTGPLCDELSDAWSIEDNWELVDISPLLKINASKKDNEIPTENIEMFWEE